MKWSSTAFLALITLSCSPNHAGPVTATSSPEGGQLIELFTSQGCSSCPPAERWIEQLGKHPDLWTRFVPIVFHVDYWDRLGWKDPFARKQYTKRQYQYQAFHQLSSVYTPGFFVDGREWKGFFQQGPLPPILKRPQSFSATWNAGRLTVPQKDLKSDQIVHAVVLGFGFKTSVKRGENAGRKLCCPQPQIDPFRSGTRRNSVPSFSGQRPRQFGASLRIRRMDHTRNLPHPSCSRRATAPKQSFPIPAMTNDIFPTFRGKRLLHFSLLIVQRQSDRRHCVPFRIDPMDESPAK